MEQRGCAHLQVECSDALLGLSVPADQVGAARLLDRKCLLSHCLALLKQANITLSQEIT